MDITQIGIYAAQGFLWLFSLASVAVIIERVWSLKRAQKVEDSDFRVLREAFLRGQSASVRATASKAQGASAAALNAGLEHGSEDVDIMREAIAQEVVVQTSQLQKNLAILATVASTAPYVGLFGTVLGILHAFHTIASTGQTGAAVVAGGISEALITTALGLGVAIPAVMAYNFFNGWVSRLSLVVETHALDLASRLGVNRDPAENQNNGVPQAIVTGEKA